MINNFDRFLKPDGLFLNTFVDDFISESLKNDLIPSIALDVIAKLRKDQTQMMTARNLSSMTNENQIDVARKAIENYDSRINNENVQDRNE